MEQIFHTDSANAANDLKLPILKRNVVAKKSGEVNYVNGDRRSQQLKTQEISKHESTKQSKTNSSPMLSTTNKTSKKLSKSSVKTSNLKTHSVENLTTEKLVKDPKDIQTDIQSRSRGVQTLDTEDINSLYSEGVIRYITKNILCF